MNKSQILKFRVRARNNDSKELQTKRNQFLDKIMGSNYEPCEVEKVKLKYGQGFNLFIKKAPVMTFEMYPTENEPLKSKVEIPQYFNKFHNTRFKLENETICETDKLDYDKMMFFITETISSLIRGNIHFAVFFASGMRSPHIRIYDFFEHLSFDDSEIRKLNPKQKVKLQVLFWRKHIPFGMFGFCDTSIFMEDHEVPLEFSPHWKYGTAFNLLFEYLPQEEKCI